MTSVSTIAPTPSTGSGQRHLGWALVLITVAQLMVVLDASIANIALPYIGRDLDIAAPNLSWIVTGYSLAFGGLLLLGGRLGDLYGRRRLFMIGVSLFAVASLVGGLAQSEIMLLCSRGMQGVGAAIASPAALALITTNFPAGPQRSRAFSVYATMSGVGAAVGLILGGWLTGLHPHLLGTVVDGWRLTFLINVPIGLGAAFAAPKLLQESESHPGELDLPGALSATLGLVAIVFGLTRAGDHRYGWGDTWTDVALIVGVALLAVFVMIERRATHPLLPFRILANRARATSFAVMALVPAAMFSMFFFLSLFVQNVMGYSPIKAGVAFLPFAFGMVVAATISSRLVARVDPRWLAGFGTALAGAALFGFSRIPYDDRLGHLAINASYFTDIMPFVILMSFGMGMTFVPLTLTALHGVGARDSGIGSGVLNTAQQVGGALGLATLSTVSVHFLQSKALELGTAAKSAAAQAGGAPDPSKLHALQQMIARVSFTEGATHAFLTGAAMIWLGTLIVLLFLKVKHEDLNTDDTTVSAEVAPV
jgi:EmrB/QacA subfamily drug resistance transporter